VIAVTAFLDDRWNVAVRWRMLVQTLVAIVLATSAFRLDALTLPGLEVSLAPWFGVVVSVVLIVWMTNLYNFMDGMDGFAGGMAVIGFATFALLGMRADNDLYFGLNLVIAAAALGFLFFNFPPARIFMGDTGSTTLGFLAAAMMLWAEHDGIFPIWIGVLVFSPFIVDATITLIRRAVRREKIWRAHKTHYYQRLVQAGWGHRKTVLAEYALMAACALTALLVLHLAPHGQWVVLATWGLAYLVLAMFTKRLEISSSRRKVA
jgi:UDP-N-acetylmuramyl pentapeptide phosphotransferase/UDP-N-acetylglucosamine-1-phosphate transferase